MKTRTFGRTGHASTIAIFGAAALSKVSQAEADLAMERVIAAGVNHIDIAPSYGDAELRVGPWMKRFRSRFFLGCKTMERSKDGALVELQRSLERLETDSFDLYQLHAVTTFEDLDRCTAADGALEALVEARRQGLVRFIGITGHGNDSPAVFLEALRRFDFDSVLFPINPVQYGLPAYRSHAEELLAECRDRQVGTMAIKSIARQPWGTSARRYDTWYEPFDQLSEIKQGVDFALSQDVTGLCTSGDVRILPLFLQACEEFSPRTPAEQENLIAAHAMYSTIF